MNQVKGFGRVLVLAAGLLLLSITVFGQASLAGENILDTIEVYGTLYTCVRDALKEEQWYYIPNSPRLVEHQVKGKMVPKFTLVRYQFKNEKRRAGEPEWLEGGILQFEINMALPPKVVGELKKSIAKRINKKEQEISLGALPFSSARVHVYNPLKGRDGYNDYFISATPTEGIAPNVATGSIPFSFTLEGPAAADIMTALVQSQGGVPVVIDFEYAGITPPVAGLWAEVDMKRMYSHFEKSEKSRASVGGWFWKASYTRDYKQIRETISESGAVKFSELQSDDPKAQETMDQFRDWVLERVAKDLLVLDTPPPKIDPANAQMPGSGWFGGGGHSVAIRQVDQKILVNKKYSAEVRRTVTRHSVGGGLIGIGTYPKEIRDPLVFDVPAGNWDKVFYTMPSVSVDPSVGIRDVKLEIGIRTDKGEKKRDAARFDPDVGSWTYGDDYVSMMSWGLKGLAADEEKGQLKIHTKLTVSSRAPYASGADTRIFESEIPAFDGKSFVSMPTDTMWAYMIFADSLSFQTIDPDSALNMVVIALTVKDADGKTKTARFNIRPDSRNPYVEPIGFLVPEDAREVKADISFYRKGASTLRWSENGKNLLEMPEYASVLFLDDTMWKE